MTRTALRVFWVSFLFFISLSLSAQVRLAIVPVQNLGDPQYQAIADSITRTIGLTFNFLGGYEVEVLE